MFLTVLQAVTGAGERGHLWQGPVQRETGTEGTPEQSCVVQVGGTGRGTKQPSFMKSLACPGSLLFFPVSSGDTPQGDNDLGSVYSNTLECLHSGRSIQRLKVEILPILFFLVYLAIITAGERDQTLRLSLNSQTRSDLVVLCPLPRMRNKHGNNHEALTSLSGAAHAGSRGYTRVSPCSEFFRGLHWAVSKMCWTYNTVCSSPA